MIDELIKFINHSPTAWHAASRCREELVANGFVELKEGESWTLQQGGRYFVVRGEASIAAFILPKETPKEMRIGAAHTDSPALKLKPNAEFIKENMVMLGTELYGAPLLTSWLNRDLIIAGRVTYLDEQDNVRSETVTIDDHPVMIPQLAIHLDRTANDSGPILNKQEHLVALAGLVDKMKSTSLILDSAVMMGADRSQIVKAAPIIRDYGSKDCVDLASSTAEPRLIYSYLKERLPIKTLLASDLFLVPAEKAAFLGSHRELLASYRIDNLIGAYAVINSLYKLKSASPHCIQMALLWNHEEIGSTSAEGAASPFFLHLMERICLSINVSRESYLRMLPQSLCASVDLGHAYNPNYPDKYEPRHLNLLNKGVILKNNAQHRYATDAKSAAEIVRLCLHYSIPLQHAVTRSDIPCGSTVGPIHAANSGIPTVDIGIAQLSMHASREIAGTEDVVHLHNLLTHFWG